MGVAVRHLLDIPISTVYECFTEGAQDVAGQPALSGGGLAVGRPVHQVHVLLVCGQHLHRLPLVDADLVLFQCIVILCHHHCGGDPVTSDSVMLLNQRGTHRHKHTQGTYAPKLKENL